MNNKAFSSFELEARRLAILSLLASADGYASGDRLLQHALGSIYGYRVGRDRLLTDLAWLEEQGMLTLKCFDPHVALAELTQRGLDAAEGRVEVPGVARPRPGA